MGEHPFAAPTPMKMLARQMSEIPARADARCAELPPPIADVLLRLMAKNKDDRLVDARAVLAAVETLEHLASASNATGAAAYTPSSLLPQGALPPQATVPVAMPQPSSSMVSPAAPPVARVHRRFATLGLLALSLVGCGLAAVLWERHHDEAGADAGSAGAVQDAGPPMHAQRVVLYGVPTFAALRAVEHGLLRNATLERYTKEESVLLVADDVAERIAEILQGQPLVSDEPLVLEVEALDAHGVTARALSPGDASAIRGPDGGLVDQAVDAGDLAIDAGLANGLLAPGGLAP